MNKIIEIIPAVMPHDMNAFREQAQMVSKFASIAQLDVMDGTFVPGISWPFDDPDEMTLTEFPVPSLVWEAHLMIKDPRELGEQFAQIGAERIVAHIEACASTQAAEDMLHAWKRGGARQTGISLLLDTALGEITPLVDSGAADYVQVMGIAEIGVMGNAFDERTFERVQTLRSMYPELPIAIDGGVSADNAAQLIASGATRLAVGSDIWKSDDQAGEYKKLFAIANETE